MTTDEHLFWVDGKGWTPANRLQPGDWLLTEGAGRVQVSGNSPEKRSCEVFTLQLRGDSAFYANGVLVHDMCGVHPTSLEPVTTEVSR